MGLEWSLIPPGNCGNGVKTHITEISHLRSKGTGVFIHQLFSVIFKVVPDRRKAATIVPEKSLSHRDVDTGC